MSHYYKTHYSEIIIIHPMGYLFILYLCNGRIKSISQQCIEKGINLAQTAYIALLLLNGLLLKLHMHIYIPIFGVAVSHVLTNILPD